MKKSTMKETKIAGGGASCLSLLLSLRRVHRCSQSMHAYLPSLVEKKLFLTVQPLFGNSVSLPVSAPLLFPSFLFNLVAPPCCFPSFFFLTTFYHPPYFFLSFLRITRNQSDHFVTMLIRKPQSLYSVHGRLSAIATAMALHFYCLYGWCSAFFAGFPFHSKTTSSHTSNENIYFHLFFGGVLHLSMFVQ